MLILKWKTYNKLLANNDVKIVYDFSNNISSINFLPFFFYFYNFILNVHRIKKNEDFMWVISEYFMHESPYFSAINSV